MTAQAHRLPPKSRLPALAQVARLYRDPLGFYENERRRHGDIFRIAFPAFGELVYVADPALVKQIFTGDPTGFHAGEANASVLEPALGPSSVLTLDEDAHMRQRKLLLPPFHGESVRRYGAIVREIADADMDDWPVGEPFALRSRTQAVTLDVILRAVFGIEDPARLAHARQTMDEFARRSQLVLLFPALRRDFGRFSPWRRFKQARAKLDALIYEEIALRRTAPDADEREDVLSLLLRASHDDGSPMSDAELRDELVTVVGAGHETTATALAWAVERLLRTPRVLEQLRASLAAGDEYLDAVIKETLRTRPVITDVARKLTRPAEIGGYVLPAGTFVLPSIGALHNRDDLFPNPSEFRPERFLEGQGEGYSWIPFGGGVRRCIGAAFAQYEMQIVLRAIFERADLRAADPAPERPRVRHITIAPAHGTKVVLERPLRAPARADALAATA